MTRRAPHQRTAGRWFYTHRAGCVTQGARYCRRNGPGWVGTALRANRSMKQSDLNGYVTYPCAGCNDSFGSRMGLRVHRSKKHADSDVTVRCACCGALKDTPRYEAREYDNHFCDKECKGEWQADHATPAQTSVIVCGVCEDVELVQKDATRPARYCSQECQLEAVHELRRRQTGPENPQWEGNITLIRDFLSTEPWGNIANRGARKVEFQLRILRRLGRRPIVRCAPHSPTHCRWVPPP